MPFTVLGPPGIIISNGRPNRQEAIRRTGIQRAGRTSQTRIDPSAMPLTRREPSGVNARAGERSGGVVDRARLLAAGDVEEVDSAGLPAGGGGQGLAVGRKASAQTLLPSTVIRADSFARRGVNELDHARLGIELPDQLGRVDFQH